MSDWDVDAAKRRLEQLKEIKTHQRILEMSDLSKRVRELAEKFDWNAFQDVYQPELHRDYIHAGLEEGARWQHDKLRPLLLALADACEALDQIHCQALFGTNEISIEVSRICVDAKSAIEKAIE